MRRIGDPFVAHVPLVCSHPVPTVSTSGVCDVNVVVLVNVSCTSGPDAAAAFLREQRWFFELERRWDGGFVYYMAKDY